jgi:hypothetical protein
VVQVHDSKHTNDQDHDDGANQTNQVNRVFHFTGGLFNFLFLQLVYLYYK